MYKGGSLARFRLWSHGNLREVFLEVESLALPWIGREGEADTAPEGDVGFPQTVQTALAFVADGK